MEKIRTRFGDGSPVELSTDEVRRDLEEGTREASERGNIPALTNEELQHLFDISGSCAGADDLQHRRQNRAAGQISDPSTSESRGRQFLYQSFTPIKGGFSKTTFSHTTRHPPHEQGGVKGTVMK